MNFKRIKYPFLLCFIFSFPLTAQELITLDKAIDLTLKNNLQIKQSRLSEALSAESLKEANTAFYPSLNAGSNISFNFGRSVDPLSYQYVDQKTTTSSGNLSTSLPIFQGFRLWHQVSQYKALLEADKSVTKKVQNDLSLSVVTIYLQILSNQDFLKAAKQQLEVARLQEQREEKQFNVGTKTLADISQARSQVAASELNVTNARNQLDIAYLNLAQLMERNPADSFQVVRPAVSQLQTAENSKYSAADIYQEAADNYPDIQVARFRTLAALKNVDLAKSTLYPRLSFQGGIGTGYSNNRMMLSERQLTGENTVIGFLEGTNQRVLTPTFTTTYKKMDFSDQVKENFNQTFGFVLNIPIFNNYSSRFGVRRAKLNYQNALASEQLAKTNFNKVIYQAVTDLRGAESRYTSSQKAYEAAKDALQAIEKRYQVGLVNSLDFNQAQTQLNQREFELIQAQYDLIFRNKVLDFYLGKPLTF